MDIPLELLHFSMKWSKDSLAMFNKSSQIELSCEASNLANLLKKLIF